MKIIPSRVAPRVSTADRRRWLLPLAVFLHSLLYALLVRPWVHYDEPGHMLYVLQLLNGGMAAPLDGQLVQETADAVMRTGFWQRYGAAPSLFEGTINAIVPTVQTHHPALYYALTAALLLPLRELPIDVLLLVGRCFSAVMMTALVLTVRQTLRELLPQHDDLALLLPLAVLLNPAFSDVMSALSSDVLLNLAAAVTFLGMLRLVRDGLRPSALVPALGGLLLVLMTKRTGLPILFPLLTALAWAWLRRPLRWWWYVLLPAVGLLIAFGLMFDITGQRLTVRSWLVPLQNAYLRVNLAALLNSLLNVERAWPYTVDTFVLGWDQFFVRLAWGEDRFAGDWIDWLVHAMTAIGLIAALPHLVRSSLLTATWLRRWHWLTWLSLAAAQIVLILRLHPIGRDENPWLPSGRYMFWAMTAVAWLVVFGWYSLSQQRMTRWLRFIPVVVLGIADGAALLHLVRVRWFS